MVTGDGAFIKKINRSIILEKIMEHEQISRADLSKITGLNKATISVQVADLLEEELICETTPEHHTVGRRPIMLSINSNAAYVLGIDLDYQKIDFTLANLQGHPVLTHTEKFQTTNYEDIVSYLIKQIKKFQKQCDDTRFGMAGVVIGVHGTVNKDERIHFIPTYKWYDKDLRRDLQAKLNLDIRIENNANLSSFAENVYQYHTSKNLFNIILTSGIGAGIINDGEIQSGYHGYAGEMGHMIVAVDGRPCSCGNKGCWEQYASETSLIQHLSTVLDRSDLSRDDVLTLLAEEDTTTIEEVEKWIVYIAIGLNNVINLYNPETVVINSEILSSYHHSVNKLESHLHSSVSQYCKIVLSNLGDTACVMGACALGIQRLLDGPKVIFSVSEIENDTPAS
ncbi:ROK family protein [Mesobacillus maritimus]|uniref:ROK family transcriptional regulator n=1 Tax=Mesobacillus maritimus TaxID=1643336 RepID=UPI00384E2616